MDKTAGIEDMLNELCTFLTGRTENFDVVISTERSGYRIFQKLEGDYLKSGVLHIPSESVHLLNLKGRNVLLFDDATTTGLKLREMAGTLAKLGASVETMVYAILDSLPIENRPTYYVRIANSKEYQEIIHGISESMRELDLPLDTDHVQVEGDIIPSGVSCSEIYDSLAPLGDVYDGSSFGSGCQFGLRSPTFCDIKSLRMPYMTESVGTWKLRVKYTLDGKIRIIPLSFPVLDFAKGQCEKTPKIRFCEDYGKLFDNNEQSEKLLCCFCVIYNTSEELLLSFFKSWRPLLEAKGLKINLEKVVYEDAKTIFNNIDLEKWLFSEIRRILIQ